MDDSFDKPDKHFSIPQIRQIEAGRPLDWPRRGWRDLSGEPRRQPQRPGYSWRWWVT